MNNNLMNRDNNNSNLVNSSNNSNFNAGNNGNNLFNTVVNNTQPTPPTTPAHGMAIASMVLGIVSLALILVNNLFAEISVPGSLAAAIVGIVLAAMAKKKGNNTGIRKAGLITSIVGTALNGALMAAFRALCGFTGCAVCSGIMAGM